MNIGNGGRLRANEAVTYRVFFIALNAENLIPLSGNFQPANCFTQVAGSKVSSSGFRHIKVQVEVQ